MALTRILMITLANVQFARLELVSAGVERVGNVGDGQRSRRWCGQEQQMVRHLAMALTRILMMTLVFGHLARLELVAAGFESVRGRRDLHHEVPGHGSQITLNALENLLGVGKTITLVWHGSHECCCV